MREQKNTPMKSFAFAETPKMLFVILLITIVHNAFSQKEHPYLFYTPQRINRLKKCIQSDTLLANSWNVLKRRCDDGLNRARSGDMEQFAFCYNMTGDVRYAEKAKVLLYQIVNKPYWDGMDDRSPRWNAGLNTSHNNYSTSLTFDAIYNILCKDEREDIAAKIVRLGITPSIDNWTSKNRRIHSLNSMGHNWWAAIVFETGVASLAVMNEVPEAKQWASGIMEESREWFAFSGSVLENKTSNFDSEGGFYESVNYTSYAISEYLNFRLAWTNALGAIHMPYDEVLQKSADWFINACYPRSKGPLMSLNFGDGNDFANGEQSIRTLIALGFGKENYSWYLNEVTKGRVGQNTNLDSPMGMLYKPENKTPESLTLLTSALYPNIGWGMMRNSWQPDATFLGVKCGYTWNHAHADAGSFVLYHKGEYLLIDGGDVGYGNPEYSSYFVTSRAHNVMMFNGEAQDPQDQYHAVKSPGHLYNLIDGGSLKYLLADATGPTSKNFLRNYRNFLWIGNVILIIDDVHTYDIGQFDFLLHYADTAIKKGPDFEITKGKAGILFRPLYPEMLPLGYPHDLPEKMKFRTEYGLKDRTTNVKIPYYVISAPEKNDRTKFINAILLLDESNKQVATFTGSSGASGSVSRSNLPVIEKFEGRNFLGVRITQNGMVTEFYVNLLADGRLMHRNANINMNGWETDAYICAFTFPQNENGNDISKLTSYFVSNGSYLRSDNKMLLSSLSKVFLYASRTDNNLEVQLQGQPLINLSLAEKINKLTVKRNTVAPNYDRDKMLIIHVDEKMKRDEKPNE